MAGRNKPVSGRNVKPAAGPGKDGASGDLGRRVRGWGCVCVNTSKGVFYPPAQRAMSRSLSPLAGSLIPSMLAASLKDRSAGKAQYGEPTTQSPGSKCSRANLESTHAVPFPARARSLPLSSPIPSSGSALAARTSRAPGRKAVVSSAPRPHPPEAAGTSGRGLQCL